MASYFPHIEASDIRFSYSLYGGPATASFLIPNARASLFALGSTISIGEHWYGEVISHDADEYQTRVVCAGLSRRLDSIQFHQYYNYVMDDAVTLHPANNVVTDAGELVSKVADYLLLVGLAIDPLTVGFSPIQVEVGGSLRSVLDTLAYAAGRGWYVDQTGTIRWGTWSVNPSSPTLRTIENVRNVLIIESGRKKTQFDKSSVPENEVALREYLHSIAITDVSGSGYTADSRFQSGQQIFIAHNAASRSVYGTREERLSVPYVGDEPGALAFATQWFSIFAQPIESETTVEFIQTPGPGVSESLPHERAATSVDVSVLTTGALEVQYNVSMGELMASPLMRGNLQRPFDAPSLSIDTTPPRVEMTTSIDAPRSNPIQSNIKLYVRAEDEKQDGTKTIEVPVIQITSDPADFTSATELAGALVDVPPASEDGWYEFEFDIKAMGYNRNDLIAYRAKAVDAAGNVGYSSVVEGEVDGEQPDVSFSVSEYNYGEGAEMSAQPTGLKEGLGTIVVTVSDISKISRVYCTHGNLVFIPGTSSVSPIDGAPVTTQDRWQGTISVSGVEKVIVYAEDVFGNIGSKWEYFWNTDDPLPIEWDKTPPSVTVSTSPNTDDSRNVVGSPLIVFATVNDRESGPGTSAPLFQFSTNGINFDNYAMVPAIHPTTGLLVPNWYMISFNLSTRPRGTKIWYRVRGTDAAGNIGYSSVEEAVVDDEQPQVSMTVSSLELVGGVETESSSQPKGLAAGRGQLVVTVSDASNIDRVTCTHGTLVFVPGTSSVDPVTGHTVTTADSWKGTIQVYGVEKVVVKAYDIFDNVGEDWEWYWNSDDPMDPQWDKTAPNIMLASAPSNVVLPVVGSPLLLFAQISDKESGPNGLPWLELSTDGLVYTNVGTFVSPAVHPETGDLYVDWSMITYDLSAYNRGQKIWYRVGGLDLAGNIGYSTVTEAAIDNQQPVVSMSVSETGVDSKDRQPTGLKHGDGVLSVTVTDASTIDHVTCSHGTLAFVAGTSVIDPVTGDPVTTSDRWEGPIHVSGTAKVVVTAVDVFGNSGSDWEWYWNSDDPMDPDWDKTPPTIQMTSSPSVERPSVVGNQLCVFAKAEDAESGMQGGLTLEVGIDGVTFPTTVAMTTPAVHPETGDSYPGWYQGDVDLSGWARGTKISYRVSGVDRAGNVGYSSISSGVIDDQQPEVSLNVSEYNFGDGLERSKQPTGLKHGLGTINVTVSDASSIVHVWCDALVGGAGELTFVPGTSSTDPVTGDTVTTTDTWTGAIQVHSVQKVTVTATDIFGNMGTDWEYFWNTDDPMPIEWDKTGPSVGVSASPSSATKATPVGSPFLIFANPTDAETGIKGPVTLQISENGMDFNHTFPMTSPATDPSTGATFADWYQVSVDLKGTLGLTRGTRIWYRVAAVDNADNIGYSSVVEVKVDADSPTVTVNIDKDPAQPTSEKQPVGLSHGFGWITVKVDDVSVIDTVTCNHATLEFVPGVLDGDGNMTADTWQGTIDPPISGVEQIVVTVVDTFGNVTEEKEWYWNTDDPMPLAFDHTGPVVSMAMSASTPRKDSLGIGTPLIVYANAEDKETEIDPATYVLEIGHNGIQYPYSYPMSDLGDPQQPGWYMASVDIKNELGFSSGDLIFYRCRCTDIAGNVGYSSITEGLVDGIPPGVVIRVSSYNADDEEEDAKSPYEEVTGDLRVRITVTDASAVSEIHLGSSVDHLNLVWSGADTATCYKDPDDTDGNVWIYDAKKTYRGKTRIVVRVVDAFGLSSHDIVRINHLLKEDDTNERTTAQKVEDMGDHTINPDIDGSHIKVGSLPLDRLEEAVEGAFTQVIGSDTYKLEFVLDDPLSPNHAKMILTRNGVEESSFMLWNGNPLHHPFFQFGKDGDGGRLDIQPRGTDAASPMLSALNWFIRQDGRSTIAARAYFTDD